MDSFFFVLFFFYIYFFDFIFKEIIIIAIKLFFCMVLVKKLFKGISMLGLFFLFLLGGRWEEVCKKVAYFVWIGGFIFVL